MSSTGGSRLPSPVPAGRFPTSSRVRKRAEFLSIQNGGQRVSTPRFVLILTASSASGSPRLGVTASRRVGNSVVRSRAKRLCREAFRATRELWPKGIDLVVIVKRATEDSKLDSVVNEWLAARAQIDKRLRTLLGAAAPNAAPPGAAPRS
ncbi:MAG: ribonuclease P protein component [Polyangiaceae bacterium]